MTTLIVADDDPSLRLLVSATIGSDHDTVLEAADGDEAWKLIQTHRPTVAVLDVQMPGKTGLELTQAIKGDPVMAGTKVILLTAKGQTTDVEAGLAAGADCYLTKPFSPLALLKAIAP